MTALTPQRDTDASLRALQRIDPAIASIVAAATHTTLYTFCDDEWQRGCVEGPLFVVSRSQTPRVRIVVLNRLSTDNLVEDVDQHFEIELVGHPAPAPDDCNSVVSSPIWTLDIELEGLARFVYFQNTLNRPRPTPSTAVKNQRNRNRRSPGARSRLTRERARAFAKARNTFPDPSIDWLFLTRNSAI